MNVLAYYAIKKADINSEGVEVVRDLDRIFKEAITRFLHDPIPRLPQLPPVNKKKGVCGSGDRPLS